MQKLFQDILEIDEVQGVFFISPGGEIVFNSLAATAEKGFPETGWAAVMGNLAEIRETEIVFEHCMLYIVKTKTGYVVVVMGKSAPIAMVRLNCSIIIPSLEQRVDKSKGLRRFFRRNAG